MFLIGRLGQIVRLSIERIADAESGFLRSFRCPRRASSAAAAQGCMLPAPTRPCCQQQRSGWPK
jgi:hypothetical protein